MAVDQEKHEPVSDIDTVAVDSLKALDPNWPIREADNRCVAIVCPLLDKSGQRVTLGSRRFVRL